MREAFEVATDVIEEMQGYQQHLKNWEIMQTDCLPGLALCY
jgi:hypothetical protein